MPLSQVGAGFEAIFICYFNNLFTYYFLTFYRHWPMLFFCKFIKYYISDMAHFVYLICDVFCYSPQLILPERDRTTQMV